MSPRSCFSSYPPHGDSEFTGAESPQGPTHIGSPARGPKSMYVFFFAVCP